MSEKGFRSVRSTGRMRRFRWLPPRLPLTVVTVVSLCGFSLYLVDTKVRPSISVGARAVAIRAANSAINKAVTEEVSKSGEASHIVHFDVGGSSDFKVADFDFSYVTKLQSEATNLAEAYLSDLSDETLRLPVAQAFGGALFSTIGPAIPVRVNLVGTAHSSVTVESKTVGINQTVHVLYLELQADVQVVAPLVAQPASVHTKVPLAYVVFNGQVPNTFYGGPVTGPLPSPSGSGS